MKPETKKKEVELSENEKLVFDLLSKEGTMSLGTLKEAAGLSNKQWDKSVKGLAKLGLTKVTKTDSDLIIEIV
jgi:lysyl-tRNA synthetase class 2